VLHALGTTHSTTCPPCMLSVCTQTCDPEMESADRLFSKLMHDFRPWGRRAKSHPAIVKPATVKKKAPLVQRSVNASRSSLATPTGPIPTQNANGMPYPLLTAYSLTCCACFACLHVSLQRFATAPVHQRLFCCDSTRHSLISALVILILFLSLCGKTRRRGNRHVGSSGS
jgi:hypothetical protein